MFRTPEPLLLDRREKQVIVGNIFLRIKKKTRRKYSCVFADGSKFFWNGG